MGIRYVGGEDTSKENTMMREIPVGTFGLVVLTALALLPIGAVAARTSNTFTESVRLTQCFQDDELSEQLTTLKLQMGPDERKVYQYLLAKGRSAPRCRTQLVQALIRVIEQSEQSNGSHSELLLLGEWCEYARRPEGNRSTRSTHSEHRLH